MPVRAYSLIDVLKKLNQDSAPFIAPNSNEIVSQFVQGTEIGVLGSSWTDSDQVSYPFMVADQDGPTGFWLLGDLAGSTTAFDSNPYGFKFPGSVTGGVSFRDNQAFTNAYAALFDGSTGYVDAGSSSFDPSATKSYSIEAWIRPTSLDTNFRRACGAEATVNHGTFLYWQSAVGWGFHRGDVAAGSDDAVGGTPSTGAFAHVVGTYDGTNMRLYVNGSLVATTPSSRSADVAGATFRIGGTQASLNGAAWIGLVAVYPVALSGAQVANHYAWSQDAAVNGAAFTYDTTGTLSNLSNGALGYWRCDDPIGSVVANDIKNARDGTGGGSGYQFGWPGRGMPWGMAPLGPQVKDTQFVVSFDARYPGRIAIPSVPANLSTGAMTFSAWVYVLPDARTHTTTGSFEQFMTRLAPGFDPNLTLCNILGTFPNLGLTVKDNGSGFSVQAWLNGNALVFSGIPYGTWTHIGAVYTGAGSATREVYINGISQGLDTTGSAADFTAAMRIGEDERWSSYDTTLNGCIAECVIFPTTLSGSVMYNNVFGSTVTASHSPRYGTAVYPNPPKRGGTLWGSALWGSFLWG